MSRKVLYKEVFDIIHKKILNNELPPGALLFSERNLMSEYNVSRDTIRKALSLLVKSDAIKIIPRIGYEVNDQSHQKKVKENLIGVILTDGDNPKSLDYLNEIEKILRINNYSIVVGFNQNQTNLENEIIEKFGILGIKGLVIIPATRGHASSLLNALIIKKFPVVALGEPREWKIKKKLFNKIHVVCENNEKWMMQCLLHLESMGHEEICFIKPENQKFTSIREKSFLKLRKKKSARILSLDIKFNSEKDIETIKNIMESKSRPTAIIAYNTTLGLLSIQIIQKLGYQIPEDMSVICIGSLSESELNIFPITNLVPLENEVAEKIYFCLNSQLNNEKIDTRLYINNEIKIRHSTCKLRY
jgi:GntR family transcriptional regulator of arabinose operon